LIEPIRLATSRAYHWQLAARRCTARWSAYDVLRRDFSREATFRPNHGKRGPAMPKFTEPGKWYFVVDCLACEKPIPLAEAPSPDERPDPLPYRIVSNLRCPHCDYVSSYTPRQMSRRMAQ
jgi:hypothetical protein